MVRGKSKGYKKLLVGKDKIPTANKYAKAISGSGHKKKEIQKLGDFNEEIYKDLILSINHTTKVGSVTFSLIKNCKTAEYPEGSCRLT